MPGHNYWQRPTLAQPIDALPSGLQRFTSVFGMGTGGATALGSPETWRIRGWNPVGGFLGAEPLSNSPDL